MSRKAASKRSAKPSAKSENFPASPDPDETLVALARTLDFAAPGRFLLAFAKCNLPLQRRALVERLKVMLEPLNIRLLEVDLTEPVTQVLPILREQLGSTYLITTTTLESEAEPAFALPESRGKVALFVYGLNYSLPARDPKPPLLDHLNFSRELFRRDVPCPLVIWLPDYALTILARGAPDFWAWRSGVFEFPLEFVMPQRVTREAVYDGSIMTRNLSIQPKRGRLHLLERLIEDYRELGDGKRERRTQADILLALGNIYESFGEWNVARNRYDEARRIFNELDDRKGLARTLLNLAVIAQYKGDLEEANRLYNEARLLYDQLNDKAGLAGTLHQLGLLAQETGDYAKARRLYEQSQQLFDELGDKQDIAISLHQLGRLAHDTGDLAGARRLYEQSLQTSRELNDRQGIAVTLHQLAMLAQDTGDLAEARRLYEQSLQTSRELGNKQGIAQSLHQLGRLAEEEGHLAEALPLFEESFKILNDLQSPDAKVAQNSIAQVREQLAKNGNG